MLDGKEYHLLFDLNVIDELQDRFGGYDKIDEKIDQQKCKEWVKNLRWLLTILINEGLPEEDTPFTEKQVGKMINPSNMAQMKSSIYGAFTKGLTGGEPTEKPVGNDEGNKTGVQD